MYLQVLVLPVFIVSYGIAKCIKEIASGSVMCHYLTANELIYDRKNTLYNNRNITNINPSAKDIKFTL